MIQYIIVALIGLIVFGLIGHRIYRLFVPNPNDARGCSGCSGCGLASREVDDKITSR